MSIQNIVKRIAEVGPQFNHLVLRGIVRETVDNSYKFPAFVFEESFKISPAKIRMTESKILSPEERVRFEVKSSSGKPTRTKIPLTMSHFRLVEYGVEFEGNYISTRLKMPYTHGDMLISKNKPSMIKKVILEKTFSRVSERDKDGVSISPIRVILNFNRRMTFRIQSFVTGRQYSHFIVTGKLFHGELPKPRICDTTVIHYMLAKFGVNKTILKFGLSPEDVFFTDVLLKDTDEFEYFVAKQISADEYPNLFLKVKKTVLDDATSLKFIVNFMYTLSHFRIQNMSNIYVLEGSVWKVMLGLILYADKSELKAYSNAETHLRSVDSFIDPITRDRFNKFGVPTEDIYELLVYIFINIDGYMVNTLAQDLYNTRVDVSNGILVGSYAKKINRSIYRLANKTVVNVSDVRASMRFNPDLFKIHTSNKTDDSEHYITSPVIVGDNFLLSGGLNKIRLGGRAEQRFHPSMAVVESIGAFVGQQIGKTGYINPYVPTDEYGAIIHPDYAKEIDDILPYLPR